MQKMVLECFFSEFGAFASRPMGTSQFRGSAASNIKSILDIFPSQLWPHETDFLREMYHPLSIKTFQFTLGMIG